MDKIDIHETFAISKTTKGLESRRDLEKPTGKRQEYNRERVRLRNFQKMNLKRPQ